MMGPDIAWENDDVDHQLALLHLKTNKVVKYVSNFNLNQVGVLASDYTLMTEVPTPEGVQRNDGQTVDCGCIGMITEIQVCSI
jgi:hypothetical protein